MQSGFSAMLRPPPSAGQYAETQFEIIKKCILDFQSSLDQEHDVGVLLASFGSQMQMEVTHIGFHPPVLLVFKGFVDEKPTTLIQHISQINFLLQSIPKKGFEPIRIKGFTVD